MPKIWVRRTTLNREKKRGLPKGTLICRLHANVGNKTGRGEEKRQKQQSFSVRLGQECGLINGTIVSGGIRRQIILLDCTYF